MAFNYKTLVSIAGDTVYPRDRVVLTPWFTDSVNGNAQAIADSLAAIWTGAGKWIAAASPEVNVSVYVYTAEGTPMGPPIATKTLNSGGTMTADGPREVALCLSFYAGTNVKRKRGRLYLPLSNTGITMATARPNTTAMTRVMAMATALAGVGPASVQWAVHSAADGVLRPVTNAWCDNEWDTQRRRGLRADTRQTAAVTA
jgi:hypothetical protein